MKRVMGSLFGAGFKRFYDADQPVPLRLLREYRGDSFPASGPYCWVDQGDALFQVARRAKSGDLSPEDAEICHNWIVNGYHIAKGLISPEEIDTAWAAYEAALHDGTLTAPPDAVSPDDSLPGRILDPHIQVPALKALQHHPEILRLTDLFFGRRTLPFQTIMGHKGSSQRPHSDAVHMTTYPLGYLTAAWVAFEDISEASGPLEYYPKSHRLLPYLLSHEVGLKPGEFRKNAAVYAEKYEPAVQAYLDAYGLQPETFLAQKGDVLFWHSNLVHGGRPRTDLSLTRKALVCHYFAEKTVTYHDLSGMPSRLHRRGIYAPVELD